MRIGCYETHAACELFPLMSNAELDDLAHDIRRNGLSSPIVLHEGRILDGRNRLLACLRVRAQPRFEAWRGRGSPLSWLVSMNLHRRHLDTSQRALIAARALAVFEVEARQRQGRRTDLGAKLAESDRGKASERAASLANVAPRTVENAKAVLRYGTSELVESVERGSISVSAAARAARREHADRSDRAEDRDRIGRFNVIVAFPCWADPRDLRRYSGVEMDALAAPDTVLFLATPDPFLPRALRMLAHWGFEYAASIVVSHASGEKRPFVVQHHDFILVGSRGAHAPLPRDDRRPGSIFEVDGTDGSAQHEAVLEQIERMFPDARRLQLFGPSPRTSWSAQPDVRIRASV